MRLLITLLVLLAFSGTAVAAGLNLGVLWRYNPSEWMLLDGYLPGQGLMVYHNLGNILVMDNKGKVLKKYTIKLNSNLPPPITVEGDYFAVGEENGTLTLFDAKGDKVWTQNLGDPITCVDLDAQGNVAAVMEGGKEGFRFVLIKTGGQTVFEKIFPGLYCDTAIGAGGEFWAVSTQEDGNTVVTRLFRDGKEVKQIPVRALSQTDLSETWLSLSPNEQYLIIASRNADMKIVTTGGDQVLNFPVIGKEQTYGVWFLDEGEHILTEYVRQYPGGEEKRFLAAWDLSGRNLWEVELPEDASDFGTVVYPVPGCGWVVVDMYYEMKIIDAQGKLLLEAPIDGWLQYAGKNVVLTDNEDDEITCYSVNLN